MPKVESSRKKSKDSSPAVPYVYGFRPATKRKQLGALGYLKETDLPAELRFDGFDPIKPCTSKDDWLAQYNESAQSVSDFIAQTPWLTNRKRKHMTQEFVPSGKTLPEKYPQGKIYFLPLGDFDEEFTKLLDLLIKYTELFLRLPVIKLPTIQLDITDSNISVLHTADKSGIPLENQEREILWSRFMKENGNNHHQLCASEELMGLNRYLPEDGLFMITLTTQDLYQQATDLFVAGIGAGYQRFGIFSLYRYSPNLKFSEEFWYDVRTGNEFDRKECFRLLLRRGCRLLVHEIGHLLGFKHCVYFNCCMNGSGHLKEDFSQPLHFCPVDLCKLQTLCGFDIPRRYHNLEAFYREHGMSEEAGWVSERQVAIQECKKEEEKHVTST